MGIDITGLDPFGAIIEAGSSDAGAITPTPDFWPSSSNSGFDLASISKTISDAATAATNTIFSFQNAQLSLAQKQADLQTTLSDASIKKTNAETSQEIAKIQAQNALKAAQNNPSNIGQWGSDAVTQALSGVTQNLNAASSGNRLMIYLAIAGVGFAALQYFKKGRG